MNGALVAGVVCVGLAVGLLGFVLVGDTSPRISRERRLGREVAGPRASVFASLFHGWVGVVERIMNSSGRKPFSAEELELADVRFSVSQVVAAVSGLSLVGLLAGILLRQNVWLGLVTAALVPVVAKLWLRLLTKRRQRAFNQQLDQTLQMLASSLRAGQSFPQALDTCARDAESPMSDELSRIVNENRIGRDIIDAMEDTAERMDCEDLVWLAEAVETTRESGGNLNEIIDRVAQTIRERAEIREKIHAYASEGRLSAYVLMGLPIFVGVAYSFMAPGYLDPLFTEGLGRVLLAGSSVMFVIAYFWMRSIVDIKV